MNYQTLRVSVEGGVYRIQLYRPEHKNTINDVLIKEFASVVEQCEREAKIVIVEGLTDVFCFGADFQSIAESETPSSSASSPEPLYELWLKLVEGSFVSIAHVRGQCNAGGMGFVAACDLVFADESAVFSLSEMLFGLMPACVLPFLIRKIAFQKAHAMTLMTKPVSVNQAYQWGLVDELAADSNALLNRQLRRLNCLDKAAIARYKRYMNSLDTSLRANKTKAIAANLEVFSDQRTRGNIARYVGQGKFPWEQ